MHQCMCTPRRYGSNFARYTPYIGITYKRTNRHPSHPRFLRIALIQTGWRFNNVYRRMYTWQYNLFSVLSRCKRPILCYISFEKKKADCVIICGHLYKEIQFFPLKSHLFVVIFFFTLKKNIIILTHILII